MMQRQVHHPGHRRSAGFTLLNVLAAALIFGLGMLGIVRAFVGVTSAATQNENVSNVAALSNSFWGVLQSNSAVLVDTQHPINLAVGFTSANITSAPTALQPWLTTAMVTSPTALPDGKAVIVTGNDPVSNTACGQHTGCSVTLTLSWTQVGAAGGGANVTRQQTFYYVVGR